MQTKNIWFDFSKINPRVVKVVEKILFSLTLFFLPFWNVNEGVDFADIGYSLNNYANYEALGTTWKLATYLANGLGRFLMALPGGHTLLGMNCYTSLLVSGMAVLSYFFVKKWVPALFAWVGEVFTICLCWCPTVILYNYLTYFFLLVALLFLYRGIGRSEDGKGLIRGKGCLLASGVLLGVNVFVRFPNLTEAAFIVLVWYAAWVQSERMTERKERWLAFWQKSMQDTLWCMCGYLAGFVGVFGLVCVKYGLDGYLHMLTGMSAMESSGARYSTLGMLTGPFLDYLRGMPWFILLVGYALAGLVLFRILPGRWMWAKYIVFLAGMPFLYRFFWGRAMFSTNYYSYGAMFWPTILVIVATLGICMYRLVVGHRKGGSEKPLSVEERIQTMLVLLIVCITPLGSNNKSYPVMNNLFLVLPFLLCWGYQLVRRFSFPIRATVAVYMVFFAIQIGLFGATFTFGDGSPQQKRDAKIENNDILRGIHTTSEKKEVIDQLTDYYESAGGGRGLVCYGNIPAFPYYLGAETAIGSAWPDLNTYAMEDYYADMHQLEEHAAENDYPIILISSQLDEEDQAKEKYQLLLKFIQKYQYEQVKQVGTILVYDRVSDCGTARRSL